MKTLQQRLKHREEQKRWRLANPEKYKELQKEWRLRNPYSSLLYRRTFKGYFIDVYRRMKWRCNGGAHKRYLGLPLMGRDQWNEFLEHTMGERLRLFNGWKDSGYQVRLAPSIDRLNSAYGYLPDNCRWLTQAENSSLGGRSKRHYLASGK